MLLFFLYYRGSIFIISSWVLCSLYKCGLTQQVRIGRGTTWQGCETNFLSLAKDVISLTSICLITGPISRCYLGPAITSTCGPLVADHPKRGHSSETPPMSHPLSGWISVGALTFPLCRTHSAFGPVAEKSPSCPMLNSSPRPPDFVPAALTTRLQPPENTQCCCNVWPLSATLAQH